MFLNFLVCQDCPTRVKFCKNMQSESRAWRCVNHAVLVHCYEWFEWTTRIDVGITMLGSLEGTWMKALDYLSVLAYHISWYFMPSKNFHWPFSALRCSGDKMDPRQLPVMFSNPRMCNHHATTHFFLGNHKLTFILCLGVPKICHINSNE